MAILTIRKTVKSKQKEYVIENIVMGQTIIKEDTPVDITVTEFEYQCKNKTRVIQNGAFVNDSISNLANLSETRTFCKYFSVTNFALFWLTTSLLSIKIG